ncbi:BnaA03g60250D [Brassica napus]|uniref:BnaA03g60250D protein n=1 Tax=Brassica napus TaxID=3708 RepID=A0A078GM92_BRANA|nr:BnaA03g60250D [Brassica napus]
MSPEIFKAVNNGGIQKLFPIHACIGNRKKGETALMYVALMGRSLESVYFIGYKTPDLDE